MRLCCISFLVGLLVVTWVQPDVTASNANGPAECCFKMFKGTIPNKKIVSYKETRLDCTNVGVIFITKKGLRICVKPHAMWVKTAMQKIDEKQLREKM